MKEFKIVIIDDEASARSALRAILTKHFKNHIIVGEAENVEQGSKIISKTTFDILLLDIQMPDGTGFDLLSRIDKKDFHLIFTTAFDNFAIKAFEFSAIGYLLKPISIEELEKTLGRIYEEEPPKPSDKTKQLDLLMELKDQPFAQIDKMVIPTVDGFEVIKLDNLVRCEGERNYTRFTLTNNQSFLTSKTLKKYEEILSEKGFLRIHKSHLINLNQVTGFSHSDGGNVIMSDGASLSISREKKAIFNSHFSA